MTDWSRAGRLVAVALAWFAAVGLVALAMTVSYLENDVRAYWSAWRGGLYATLPELDRANYIYPPPLAQAIWPLTFLPWSAFAVIWYGACIFAIWWLLRPVNISLRIPLFVAFAATGGNAAVFVAVAIASRASWAWALPLLTKITPGVGLLWYVARREWRQLAIALATAALIVGLSVWAAPELWGRWFAAMLADRDDYGGLIPFFMPQIPLWIRVPMAAGLVLWGARRSRSWVLAVAAVLASPDILPTSLPLLAALPRLLRSGGIDALEQKRPSTVLGLSLDWRPKRDRRSRARSPEALGGTISVQPATGGTAWVGGSSPGR